VLRAATRRAQESGSGSSSGEAVGWKRLREGHESCAVSGPDPVHTGRPHGQYEMPIPSLSVELSSWIASSPLEFRRPCSI